MNASSNTGGRPKILSMRQKRIVIKHFKRGDGQTTTFGVDLIKSKLVLDVSNLSIRNILHNNGYKNYKKNFKPFILLTNIKKRRNIMKSTNYLHIRTTQIMCF